MNLPRTVQAIVCAVIVALCAAAAIDLELEAGGEVKPRETAGNTQQKPASKTADG